MGLIAGLSINAMANKKNQLIQFPSMHQTMGKKRIFMRIVSIGKDQPSVAKMNVSPKHYKSGTPYTLSNDKLEEDGWVYYKYQISPNAATDILVNYRSYWNLRGQPMVKVFLDKYLECNLTDNTYSLNGKSIKKRQDEVINVGLNCNVEKLKARVCDEHENGLNRNNDRGLNHVYSDLALCKRTLKSGQ